MNLIDLNVSHQKFVKGGVELFLNWIEREDGHGTEQAWIFRRSNGAAIGSYIIGFSQAPKYLKRDGNPLPTAREWAKNISEYLGFGTDYRAMYIILSLICDTYEDLKNMPTDPPNAREILLAKPKAEMLMKIDGQTVLETEVAV